MVSAEGRRARADPSPSPGSLPAAWSAAGGAGAPPPGRGSDLPGSACGVRDRPGKAAGGRSGPGWAVAPGLSRALPGGVSACRRRGPWRPAAASERSRPPPRCDRSPSAGSEPSWVGGVRRARGSEVASGPAQRRLPCRRPPLCLIVSAGPTPPALQDVPTEGPWRCLAFLGFVASPSAVLFSDF